MGDRMKQRYLFLNLKSYGELSADFCAEVGRAAVRASEETGATVAVCPPLPWIHATLATGALVFSQHTDALSAGAHTGYSPPEIIKRTGAKGSLINHSEHRLLLSDIEFLVSRMRELGLFSVVCADTPSAACAVGSFTPDCVAVEPPELIGTGVSVSRAKPEVIRSAVLSVSRISEKIPVVAGAGIVDAADVKKAVELGAAGALVASAVVHAGNRAETILKMAQALYI